MVTASRQSEPLGLFPGKPTPRLYDAVIEAMRVRHYSRRTEQAYVNWIRRFILFPYPPPSERTWRSRRQPHGAGTARTQGRSHQHGFTRMCSTVEGEAFAVRPTCLAGCLAAADDTPKPCNALEMTWKSTKCLIAFDLQEICACVRVRLHICSLQVIHGNNLLTSYPSTGLH